MESTDKLRMLADACYTFNDCSDKLMAIADEIEREIAERYMELPVDADGVPIHVGDIMDFNDGDLPEKVLSVSPEKAWFGGTIGMSGKCFKHVKPRTVEDVLEEFASQQTDITTEENDALIAKYADELRSMGVGE